MGCSYGRAFFNLPRPVPRTASDVGAVEIVGAAVEFGSIAGDGTGVLLGTGVAVETVVTVAETAFSVEVGSG